MWVLPLASWRTVWASQPFWKRDLGVRERIKVGVRGIEGQKATIELPCREILLSLSVMPREYQFPFELRHLVYFREVGRLLHFRRAAEALAIAQPALSRQIAQLEKALGTP